jgi:hypothetical protein
VPWLRLDDGFAQHPKISRLTRGDRWTWLEILLYCARYRTDGIVPASISEVVPRATLPFLGRCYELHLLDTRDDGEEGYVVHDWEAYNPTDPTNAARQQRYRERQRNASVTPTVTDSVTESVTPTVTDVTPPAQARARGPSPTPTTVVPPAVSSELSAVGSKTTAPNGLPVEKEQKTIEILAAIGKDGDEQTPTVVRALAKRLPLSSLVKVNESLRTQKPKNRAAYAVGALQSEFAEIAGRK